MMNQEDIFKKIGQILSELNDQYQYLAQNPQELNDLELELFLANSNFLSDHVQIIRKINSKNVQKILPEHTEIHKVVPAVEVSAPPAEEKQTGFSKPLIEEEIFKIDKEPSTFEFILSDRTPSDQFEFEEKSVGEIFDRPLSAEEEEIIARKQKLREKIDLEELEAPIVEEDEIGPEPFLVAETRPAPYEEEDQPEDEQDYLAEEEDVADKAGLAKEIAPVDIALTEEVTPAQPLINNTTAAPEVQREEKVQRSVEEGERVREEEKIQEAEKLAENAHQNQLEEYQIKTVNVNITPPVPPVSAEPVIKPATLNDILAGNKSAGSSIGSSRNEIKDLRQAISLNDKMLYIKDLFNGYNLAYAEAVDLLNKMPDFQTADHFLQHNYAVKNNWSAKQDTADQFYELLNRRFPAK